MISSALKRVPKVLAGRSVQQSMRFNSSSPEERATSILQQLPGKSMFEKSSGLMIAASIATYLISKEIYLIYPLSFLMLGPVQLKHKYALHI